jgi:uncharacterized protein YndB with AHSA1/START domain
MVKYRLVADALAEVYSALGDTTRRGIVERLARGELTVAEIRRPLRMSAPAVSKHLRVLEHAGLVQRRRSGRHQVCALREQPLIEVGLIGLAGRLPVRGAAVSNGGDAVRLERTFAADIDRVFRAFTDPAELVHWWGPMNVPTSVAEIDLRVGGECRWVMHPGGQVAVLHGRIVDLDPPELLVMTNRWDGQDEESLVTLRLSSVPTGTHLELIHQQLPTGADPRQFRQGWEAALASLTRYLSKERTDNADR